MECQQYRLTNFSVTPPPSPCESNHRYDPSEEGIDHSGRISSRLPVQGIGSFGWPLASEFPNTWLSDSMEDCRTAISDASDESLFILPPERMSVKVSRDASFESCPGLASPSQTSSTQTESLGSQSSARLAVSSGWHDEEIRRKVQEWPDLSDSLGPGDEKIFPVEDNAERWNFEVIARTKKVAKDVSCRTGND